MVVGTFEMDVDGYYKFWPDPEKKGYIDEYYLFRILHSLRELNLEWDTQCRTDPRIAAGVEERWKDDNTAERRY